MSNTMTIPVEKEIQGLAEVFPNLDLVRASRRFVEIGRDYRRLLREYLDRGYPQQAAPSTPSASSRKTSSSSSSSSSSTSHSIPVPLQKSTGFTSSDFMKIEQAVPSSYIDFACKFLENEFPNLKSDFLISTLKKFNHHIYPAFHFICKSYFLCGSVRHPDDDDADNIYELINEVSDNYTDTFIPPKNIDGEFSKAVGECLFLGAEMEHIKQKRESYQKKAQAIKEILAERLKVLSIYEEEKKRTQEEEVVYPLVECPICSLHYLPMELCSCAANAHTACRYCLRDEIVVTYVSRALSNVRCVLSADCKAGYEPEVIRAALGRKKYKRFEEIATFNALSCLKNDPNTYSCPFCTYVFKSLTKPDQIVCQNPSCGIVTCLFCNKDRNTHQDGRCPVKKRMEDRDLQFALQYEANRKRTQEQQAEDDRALTRRMQQRNAVVAERMRQEDVRRQQRRIEEERRAAEARRAEITGMRRQELEESLRAYVLLKMDESTICECPRCHRKISKDNGCNHIRCICGCNFCYQCRRVCEVQDNPSAHFTKSGKGCRQFINQIDMDRACRERARIAAEAEWYAKNPDAPRTLVLRL